MPVCPECKSGTGFEQDSHDLKIFRCTKCKRKFRLEVIGRFVNGEVR